MNKELLNRFREARKHQMNVANNGGGMMTVFPSGRIEMSFGGAPFGEHALSALLSARSTINFRHRLAETVRDHKKRSAAAKRGWKKRRSHA